MKLTVNNNNMCPCKKEESLFNPTTQMCITCGRYNASKSYGETQAQEYLETLPKSYKDASIKTEDNQLFLPYYNKVGDVVVYLNNDSKYIFAKEDDLETPLETFELEEFPKVLATLINLNNK